MSDTVAAAGSGRSRVPILLLAVVGTLALLFFSFRMNWFGAPLDDAALQRSLRNSDSAQAVQHALEQMVARFAQRDAAALRGDFTAPLSALVKHPQWEVRRAAAWAMGHDPAGRSRTALSEFILDTDRGVRINAAVALANYNDAAGLAVLRDALMPYVISAPIAGKFHTRAKVDETLGIGRDLGHISTAEGKAPVVVFMNGWLRKLVCADGSEVAAGAVLAEVAADAPTLLNALLALQLVGTSADVALVESLPQLSPASKQKDVAAQAARTLEALKQR